MSESHPPTVPPVVQNEPRSANLRALSMMLHALATILVFVGVVAILGIFFSVAVDFLNSISGCCLFNSNGPPAPPHQSNVRYYVIMSAADLVTAAPQFIAAFAINGRSRRALSWGIIAAAALACNGILRMSVGNPALPLLLGPFVVAALILGWLILARGKRQI